MTRLAIPIAIVAAIFLTACNDNKPSPSDGATVARICRDGSYIFHYRDGSYHVSYGRLIDDINTICEKRP